ncbi:MAG: DnaJ domain-containing protein [Clostridia bacterium]|jgi:molecular chaperone DnaJ|nr:DnaJ domain-containing protein [Clostridia bacterium]
MVNDPHKVLGVAPGASEDEIKKAYRQKAKECHPDLHPDDPNATRKMNEVNEAYDMLMHPEKYQARQQQQQRQQYSGYYGQQQGNPYQQSGPYGNPFGQQGSWQQSGGWYDFDDIFGFGGARQASYQPPQEMPFDSVEVRTAVRAINMQRWQDAISSLVRVPSTGRNARWHYLFALAQAGSGNTMTAQEEMQRAVQMEPNNALYHQLLQQYRQAGQSYEQRSQGFNMSAMDPTRWCMGICLANLLCNFCRCC